MASYPDPVRFVPKNPQKYRGDPTNIIARSSWETKVFSRLDLDSNVVEWSSEEVVVPYRCPKINMRTGEISYVPRRYFVDLWIRYKSGEIRLVEIKPKNQTRPPAPPKRKTKAYLNKVNTWIVNEAKWKAAEALCKQRGWKWQLLTEDQIFG